ncbi:MAG: hypothetical protein ACYCST_09395 [Acidimicrobiales bacterium]
MNFVLLPGNVITVVVVVEGERTLVVRDEGIADGTVPAVGFPGCAKRVLEVERAADALVLVLALALVLARCLTSWLAGVLFEVAAPEAVADEHAAATSATPTRRAKAWEGS